MKSAIISIIGRPSTGKSTFLNKICKEKVSIVSSVPQTTRNKIKGIVNSNKGQLVFIDTPGYHKSDKKINLYFKNLAVSSVADSDIIIYMLDSCRKPGAEEDEILKLLARYFDKIFILINKIDHSKSHLKETAEFIESKAKIIVDKGRLFPLSAKTGEGTAIILEKLFEQAPDGEAMYPDDFYTDQQPEFRIAETIRSKAIAFAKKELPHSIYVEIADIEMKYKDTGDLKKLWVRAFLVAEKDSQKGILVGHGGDNIKKIRQESQKEFNRLFPYPVHLDLRVKINPKWRRNDSLLKKMIY